MDKLLLEVQRYTPAASGYGDDYMVESSAGTVGGRSIRVLRPVDGRR